MLLLFFLNFFVVIQISGEVGRWFDYATKTQEVECPSIQLTWTWNKENIVGELKKTPKQVLANVINSLCMRAKIHITTFAEIIIFGRESVVLLSFFLEFQENRQTNTDP